MFLSTRHKPHRARALRTIVINRDTNERIPHVIWANDKTGRYRQNLVDENGKFALNNSKTKILSKVFVGNIELREE